eukprot:9252373-Pyramimonas_sp.AAC.1
MQQPQVQPAPPPPIRCPQPRASARAPPPAAHLRSRWPQTPSPPSLSGKSLRWSLTCGSS